MARKAMSMNAKIVKAVSGAGVVGVTVAEVAKQLGVDAKKLYARLWVLKKAGKVVLDKKTGKYSTQVPPSPTAPEPTIEKLKRKYVRKTPPMVPDEITNMEPQEMSDMVYSVTAGRNENSALVEAARQYNLLAPRYEELRNEYVKKLAVIEYLEAKIAQLFAPKA